MKLSQRVVGLPPYLFAEIDRRVEEKRRQGVDVINFGVGDPDLPTPSHIVEALCEEAARPEHHRYPSYRGMPRFREAAASWVSRRFGVSLDPETETLALIGSKEGIAHFPLALLDPGDVALVPDPAYPVYRSSTLFCGGVPVELPLHEGNDFLPDLASVPEEVWRKARLLFLNYPNNPTAAVADLAFFEELVHYARAHDVILAHDLAYSEITFDGYVAPSLLEVPGARERTVEFHSLSKTYNMTGWRVGFAVGGAEVIAAFAKVKENIDSGVFNAVQLAAVAALEGPQDCVLDNREVYRRRRDALLEGLRSIGWEVEVPSATLYVWMKVPHGYDSREFTRHLLEKAEIAVAPGSAYGARGEGYVRFSLTLPDERLREGVDRLKKAFS
ncbi:MAG: LL-diaminopimelate aminotransferase [Actinomycetota bacterium]|nr:LL-diaminopimelate aminotransferase [Actinomycetota bacterium]MDD5667897.1 LL-diaminopimelate aminotransferase [Actinomycetota bacterium]